MIKISATIIFLGIFNAGLSAKTPVPAIIKRMIEINGSIKQVWQHQDNRLPRTYFSTSKFSKKLINERFYFLKNNNGLYIGIDGTGMIFKIEMIKNELEFNRIDSTYFSGNTFNAAYFTHNDSLYSYGGYGFWKSNGILRKFDFEIGEWEAIPTDREISSQFNPTGQSYIWTDETTNKLLLYKRSIHDIFQGDSTVKINELYKLDLAKKNWENVGVVDDEGHLMIFFHKNGVLRIKGHAGQSDFLDFRNNLILVPDQKTTNQLKKIFSISHVNLAYSSGDWIYFGNDQSNEIDSVKINTSKFAKSRKIVDQKENYISQEMNISFIDKLTIFNWLITGIGILIGAIISYLILKRSKSNIWAIKNLVPKIKDETTKSQEPEATYNVSQLFSDLEKALLKKLIMATRKHGSMSIEEINKLLGLSNKNPAVQKKNRNEAISRINLKWQLTNKTNKVLIEKKRSEIDKRNFEYYMNEDLWLEFNNL
ncbi:MAG: hypothetical protein RLZZ420_1488 [Bacteroidota bacterium]